MYFDSFRIEYIPQEVLNKIKVKPFTQHIFRIKSNKSIIYGFNCITFVEYMVVRKTLLDCINLFSPNDHQKNEKKIYMHFEDKYGKKNVGLEVRLKK